MLALWAGSVAAQECEATCFKKRWVYWGGNLMVTERDAAGLTPFESFNALLPKIKAAGFNGVALNLGGDGGYVQLVNPATSVERKKAISDRIKLAIGNANAAGLEVVPIGGHPELVSLLRPELQEAFPTTTPYKAVAGVASVVNAGRNVFPEAAGFELNASGWAVDAFNATYQAGVEIDPTVGHDSARSMRMQSWQALPAGKDWAASRLYRKLTLKPHTAYQVSFWLKPGAMTAPEKLQFFIQTSDSQPVAPLYRHASQALGWGSTTTGDWNKEGNSTLFAAQAKEAAAGRPTWQQYNVQFNSGNFTEAYAYFGMYGAIEGANTVWIDDVKLEEIGITHPVERVPGDYVVTRTSDGKVLTSGDYAVAGDKLTIHNKDMANADLKVAWRQSPKHMFKGVAAVACDAGDFYNVQENYYVNAIAPLFNNQSASAVTGSPKKYFMYYDEIPVLNWEQNDSRCSRKSAGDYLGHMVRSVQNPLENAGVETLTWNDMFDPNMNAIARYHQVNGSLLKTGAATSFKTGNDSIDLHPDTVIVNWTGGEQLTDAAQTKRRDSLLYFRHYPQVIALYYEKKDTTTAWLNALTAAYEKEKELDPPASLKIDGIMYTTWFNNYGDLDAVAEQIRKSPYAKYWPRRTQ
ncbi:hypothetical protein [Pseudoduganella chitinolytica]|uniref:GH26 domain-containing protein n=1 Tax=Pseudoduganella chitinolytica TaxID=34070 RepID=A0ABY8BIC2_9BURK|nr:hypothetical protein [Pseudoduganella chitinolytica]WEF34693.1 hypothetical protein PX653_08015 [Pseudoduganella chitinolytica]